MALEQAVQTNEMNYVSVEIYNVLFTSFINVPFITSSFLSPRSTLVVKIKEGSPGSVEKSALGLAVHDAVGLSCELMVCEDSFGFNGAVNASPIQNVVRRRSTMSKIFMACKKIATAKMFVNSITRYEECMRTLCCLIRDSNC